MDDASAAIVSGESALEHPSRPETPDAAQARPRAERLLLVGAWSVALLSLVLPFAAAGLWNPHEVDVVELARRIALNLLGGTGLDIPGANNLVPIQAELGRGQLPFTSIALGLRAFGLHAWAARLPLVFWALGGVLATYALVARLSGKLAAGLAIAVLCTMPLYFLHARTALGDMVLMSAAALATSGLALATFDERLGALGRCLALAVAVCGLLAGFLTRGVLVGMSVAPLAVGMTWLLLGRGRQGLGRFANTVGAVAGLVGVACLVVGVYAWLRTRGHSVGFSWLVGGAVPEKPTSASFDSLIFKLGHGLFPWSAVLPVALGRALVVGKLTRVGPAALRLVVVLAAAVGFGVHAFNEPVTGAIPFGQVFALAVIVALCMQTLHEEGRGAPVLALVVVAFALVLALDFKNSPDYVLGAFSVEDARVPESFVKFSNRLLQLGVVFFGAVFLISLAEPDTERRFFVRADYRAWPEWLRARLQGGAAFAAVGIEVVLVSAACLVVASDRYFHFRPVETLFALARWCLLFAWFVVPLGLVLVPALVLGVRDVFRCAYAFLRLSRAVGATLAGVLFGCSLSLWYYPALAAQLSPREVFEAYQRFARPHEKLGLVDSRPATATYYTGGVVTAFSNFPAAFDWLMESDERRWVVVGAEDLSKLNSRYRGKTRPMRNLPVLDARSSEILLVSNQLEPGETNQNPFVRWVLDERPKPLHPVSASLDNKLEVLGWDVQELDGRAVDAITPSHEYEFTIYYEVMSSIAGQWETFIHVDGFNRRYNGDHKTLQGKYSPGLWQVGDFIADRHVIKLEPYFSPGEYAVRFGLYAGKNRMPVKRGKHDDNRVEAGVLRVR